MSKILVAVVLAVGSVLPLAASAHTDVSIGLNLGVPLYEPYYEPYYEPRPVVRYAPPEVYYGPRYYYPGRVVIYDDGYRRGWRGHHHDWDGRGYGRGDHHWKGHGRGDWDNDD